MRYPLIQGQGNFGSLDGDGAAAMRYTECRMTPLAEEMMQDIEKDTYLGSDVVYTHRDAEVQDKILVIPIKKVDLLCAPDHR